MHAAVWRPRIDLNRYVSSWPDVWNFLLSHHVRSSNQLGSLMFEGFFRFSAVRQTYFPFLYLALVALKIGKRTRRLGWRTTWVCDRSWNMIRPNTVCHIKLPESDTLLGMPRFRPQKLEVILGLNLNQLTNLKCQVMLEEFPKSKPPFHASAKMRIKIIPTLTIHKHKHQSKVWGT